MAKEQAPKQEETGLRNEKEMLQEERYLWMARAFVVMLVLAVICDIVLLIAFAGVTPVMRVQPFYIETQNKEQQIISVKRPSADVLNSDALQESLVREYLMARLGIGADLEELKRRWEPEGVVADMSNESVFEVFKQEADKLLALAEQENFTREVRILNVNKKVGGSRYNTWFADLQFKDKNRASTKQDVRYFKAELVTDFRPARKGIEWKDRLRNPLGFVVIDFGLSVNQEKSKK